MFNNNIYSDFRTAHKHALIPSYIIKDLSDLTEPKYHKTKHYLVVWLKQTKINI